MVVSRKVPEGLMYSPPKYLKRPEYMADVILSISSGSRGEAKIRKEDHPHGHPQYLHVNKKDEHSKVV